jgi:release factor glutamine methyltransferase
LREEIDAAARRLRAAGHAAADAQIDARVLARHAFGLDEAALILREVEPADARAVSGFRLAVARRALFEPVAYITGHREFYGREFTVSSAVLIPRPETELIVELALARFPRRDAACEIVDVGTGSGCLAVTLACELPGARLVATDIATEALEVARDNARRHGVLDRIAFQLVSLTPQVDRVDLIVSNPPYVPIHARLLLPWDVRDYEPAVALYAGLDGLSVIRELASAATRVLRPGGWLICEFGVGQADGVVRLLHEDRRWQDLEVAEDLQHIPRVVAARWDAGDAAV